MAANVSDDGGAIVSLFGRDILRLGPRRRTQRVRNALDFWRATGFPYERLSRDEAQSHFYTVANAPLLNLDNGHTVGASSVGLRLANRYHPQIWHARSHGHRRCPHDYFEDNDHLRTMLERAPRFWPNNRCWSAQAVRNLARIYSGGRVANFRPVVARNIINHFSRSADVVLDFSAGYGGRLLASLTLDRLYIGIDPARKQISGLERMCEDFREHSPARAEIVKGCAEDILPGMERSSVDLVFSSPPFFNLEVYSDEPTQSSNRYKTYDRWRAGFLQVVIAQSRRLLRRNGFLAIHVSSGGKVPLEMDTLGIASKLFTYYRAINVAMPARPLQRAQNGGACRTEPIHVFRKR
jgi:DNA modification methylase